jgi:hypothetical protein
VQHVWQIRLKAWIAKIKAIWHFMVMKISKGRKATHLIDHMRPHTIRLHLDTLPRSPWS